VVRIPVEPITHGAPVYEASAAQPADCAARQHLDLTTVLCPLTTGRCCSVLLASPNPGEQGVGYTANMIPSVWQ